MQDKHGTEIKAGDMLFNPHDRDQYHTVLQGDDGRLYLGDLDSPLERYAPQTWWEVVHSRSPVRAGDFHTLYIDELNVQIRCFSI